MAVLHKVQQGEYLAKIAARYGFTNYRTIWNHPKNAQLKQKRRSPNVLYPGDMLFVPDREERVEARSTTKVHTFVAPQRTVLLRIVVKDVDDKPIGNADYVLNFRGKTSAASADKNGLIEEQIDIKQSHVGTLTVSNTRNVFDVQLGIKVGDLNPVEMPSGQMARLNNLGYFAGRLETGDRMDKKQPIDSKEEAQFKSAVEEFQCDHMGPGFVDGICGPLTQNKLREVYGC